MDKITLLLHDCFSNIKTDVISSFNNSLMTASTINSPKDIHNLIISKLDLYLSNHNKSLTEDEKKLCLVKEAEVLEYQSLEEQLWNQVQDKINNNLNRTKLDEVLVQLKNIQNQLDEVNAFIKNYAEKYIKKSSDHYEELKSQTESMDRLISFKVCGDARNEYNLSASLINSPSATSTNLENLSLKGNAKINIKSLNIVHKKLVFNKGKISNIIWPKLLDYSQLSFKDIYLNLSALQEIEKTVRDFSNLLFHLQNGFNFFDNPRMVESDSERQQLHIIARDFNKTYKEFISVIDSLENRIKELNEVANQFGKKNPIDKVYAENWAKSKEYVVQRYKELHPPGTNPIENALARDRKRLANNIHLFNVVMKDVSNDDSKLIDAEKLLEDLESHSEHVEKSLNILLKDRDLLSSPSVNQNTKRILRESINELEEMKIKYNKMKETVHNNYDQYFKDKPSGSIELNQLKSELEHIKRGLEEAKSTEVEFESVGIESLQVMYNSYCDGSYENSIFGFLKYQSPSVIEINKPIIAQCKKILSEIKELTSFLLRRAKNLENSKKCNQAIDSQDRKLNMESVDAIKIIYDTIYGQNHKNNAHNPNQKTELSDSISLSEIKMGLEQLISAFDRNQIDLVATFSRLNKYYPVITKNNMNNETLSKPEQDLLNNCLRLTKALFDKIKERYKKYYE